MSGINGQPLPDDVKEEMESQFGADFSSVRVHANAEAAKTNGARAFTDGHEIFFKPGEYAPDTQTGKKLLAHELTHVVQQQSGVKLNGGPASGEAKTEVERQAEADLAAQCVAGGMKAPVK